MERNGGPDKDRIKSLVDIVLLCADLGITLIKKGKEFLGPCPFHKDTNPSFSVNREKGVFYCRGCQAKGDIFELVKRVLDCNFKDALTWLENWLPAGAPAEARPVVATGQALPEQTPEPGLAISIVEENAPDEPADAMPPAEEESSDLNGVAEYYHRIFYKVPEAKLYLEGRSITTPEIYKRFQIGYADGSLLGKLSARQKQTLTRLGILREKGTEHFHGCVVFPIRDETGRVVNFYGRQVGGKKPAHLYLKGANRVTFNRSVTRDPLEDSVILVESIIDALSLIQLGITNVQPLYGAGGFSDEHLELLKADSIRFVILALDADEAGEKATEKIKARLEDEGFRVATIIPPHGKDWNESLTGGASVGHVREMIGGALEALAKEPVAGVAEVRRAMKVEYKNEAYSFVIGEVTYHLILINKKAVGNLKVKLKATCGNKHFRDITDLYTSRSRERCADKLAECFDLEAARFNLELSAILDYIEDDREKAQKTKTTGRPSLSEEDVALAMDLLTDLRIFDRIIADLTAMGYLGENVNKVFAYLVATSRFLTSPISMLILSQSGSGKSYLGDLVTMLIPPEEVLYMHSLSDQALNYTRDDELLHKFLAFGESEHSETVEHQIREMLSSKKLSRLVATKDEKTGLTVSRLISKPVLVSTLMSTTNRDINPENASRYFLVNSDESEEQTKRIQQGQHDKYSHRQDELRRHIVPKIIRTHQAAQRLLKPRVIINPYGKKLRFPSTRMRTRRDNNRFVDLIATACFLRQYQKPVKTKQNPHTGQTVEYIECDVEDYRIVYQIMTRGVLAATLNELTPGDHALYKEIRKMVKARAQKQGVGIEEVTFGQRDLRDYSGYGQSWIKQHLRILVDYEYIMVLKAGGRGTRSRYRLRADEPLSTLPLSMITTPEEIEAWLKEQEEV